MRFLAFLSVFVLNLLGFEASWLRDELTKIYPHFDKKQAFEYPFEVKNEKFLAVVLAGKEGKKTQDDTCVAIFFERTLKGKFCAGRLNLMKLANFRGVSYEGEMVSFSWHSDEVAGTQRELREVSDIFLTFRFIGGDFYLHQYSVRERTFSALNNYDRLTRIYLAPRDDSTGSRRIKMSELTPEVLTNLSDSWAKKVAANE